MSIRILPASVANKIAAGEVIERPASVVKEAVENSIDAGAGHIIVELDEGGAKLIRIVDDGCGIDADDLPLAFASHATSKLQDEDDLFSVSTMGFRGEALASIGSVSDARIVSRTPSDESGHEIEMRAGAIGPVKACGAPVGTQLEVRNLFHNVPVRRKFLKTTATEMAHITEAVTRLALVHPQIHFELSHRGRTVFNLPPAETAAQRIGEFFGGEIAEKMAPVAWQGEEVRVEGYLLPPSVDRRTTRMQYTYVNRRYVRDSVLMHAVSEAYSGLVTAGRRPVCFLFLALDPAAVDVNVHPSKLEIKFRRSRAVHQEVLGALRDALKRAKITPQVVLTAEQPESRDSIRQAVADFFTSARPAAQGRPPYAPLHASAHAPARAGGELPPQAAAQLVARFGNCLQVLDSYIVEETDEGVNIIDQHALHERILYNEIERRLDEGGLDSQQLLVPELVELPQQEFYAVMELAEDLARFGMAVEAFGERTVIVRSFPQILKRFDGQTFFHDLLDELEAPERGKDVEGRLSRVIKVMACRGAVKAGDRLSAEQIRWLLERRAQAGPTDTCPHGRPTTITISRAELEKQFRRT